MGGDSERKFFKTFIISLGITLVFCLAATFVVITVTNRKLIDEQARTQARTLFESIVMTRKWNAKHGGVYVEKKEGMVSNPYLENPDIATLDGKVYTKKNPALMTREISEYAEKEGLFSFHITSLTPLNPANRPSAFEAEALLTFRQGAQEVFQDEEKNDRTYFTYMAPLYVEEECLQCHAQQGYRVGDVRGGISVSFDIQDIKNVQKTSTFIILALAFFSTTIILGLMAFFTSRLMKKVAEARKQTEKMAVTDELTGLYNRRSLMKRFGEEFERAKRLNSFLGCIMIDIDKFKTINDTYGHLVGDEVLKNAAYLIGESIRPYDSLGRYGGEEFLIVLPDTHFEDTKSFAERIRRTVKENLSVKSGVLDRVTISISLGVASMKGSDSSIDDMIKRADDGLYAAKSAGRDLVSWI